MKLYVFTWLEKSYMHLEGVENFLKDSEFRLEELKHKRDRLIASFKKWNGYSPTFVQDSEGLAWVKAEVKKENRKEAKEDLFKLLDRIIQGYIPVRYSLMTGGTFPYVINYLYLFKNEKEAEDLAKEKELPVFYKDSFTFYQTQPEIYLTSKITPGVEIEVEKFETVLYSKEEPKNLIENLIFYNLWEMMLKEHMNMAVSKRKKVAKISSKMREMTLDEAGEADEKISDLIKDVAEVNEKTAQTWQCFKRKKAKLKTKFMEELYEVAKADGEYFDAHMDRIMVYFDHVENLIDIRYTLRESIESRKLEGIMGVEAAGFIASLLISTVIATELGFKSKWFKLALTILVWLLIYSLARGLFRKFIRRGKLEEITE